MADYIKIGCCIKFPGADVILAGTIMLIVSPGEDKAGKFVEATAPIQYKGKPLGHALARIYKNSDHRYVEAPDDVTAVHLLRAL